MKKISHSAWQKYLTCPRMYQLHYEEKLRPEGTTSPLLFGSAMDEALNAMLLKNGDPLEVFKSNFEFDKFKGCQFDDRDYDPEIFTKEQLKQIAGETLEYKSWASLRIKGRLLLEAYQREILPRISKVFSVQKEIEGRPGVLDAIVELDGQKVLLDHKTSSYPYKRESVPSSTQLALYSGNIGVDRIGFVVLLKAINKNKIKTCKKCSNRLEFSQHKTCPKIIDGNRCHGDFSVELNPQGVVQLIVNEVDPNLIKIVDESMSQVETGIANKHFPMNLTACGKIYGKPCQYLNFCWKNDKSGLVYKKENKEKK